MLFTSGLFAQKVTISGVVKDATSKQPLAGVTVMAPSEGVGAYTKDDGSYSFEVPAKDFIDVQIKYTGYTTVEDRIDIAGKTSVTRDFTIQDEITTTDEVVITASKGLEQKSSDLTVSIAVVKQKSIDLQATNDVSKVITQIPGVDNLDGQINIRGSSGYAFGVGSRVMVMLDGLPLLSGDAGFPELSLIPVDNISQVEVVKGASSVLYGSSALGGVINVLMRDPSDKPRTSIRLKQSIYEAPRNKQLDWDGTSSAYVSSAHIFHSRKIGQFDLTFQTDLIKDSGYRQGTDKEELRTIVLTKYRPKNVQGLTIGLNATVRVDSSGGTLYWRGYFPDTTIYEVPDGTGGIDTTVVVSGGALTPALGNGASRKQLNSRYAVDPSVKYLTKKGDLFHYRGRYLRNVNKNNTGQSAVNYILYNDFLYSKKIHENINWVGGTTVTYSVANANRDTSGLYNRAYPGRSIGIYSQFDGKFWGRLNASLGLRLETVKIDSLDWEIEPIVRAGLNYEIRTGSNIRASFGQAFRTPSVAERFTATQGGAVLVQPNPNIQSETGFSAELAFRQGILFEGENKRLSGYIDVAGFLMKFNDMIEFGLNGEPDLSDLDNISAPFSSRNIADARIIGAEITTILDAYVKDWFFNFSGGYTFIEPVNLNAAPEDSLIDLSCFPCLESFLDLFNDSKVDNPRTLKYRTKHTVRFSATAGFKKFSFTANFRYRSFIQEVDEYLHLVIGGLNYFRTEVRPDGQKVVDMIAAYDITDKATLSLTVDNVFNQEYMVIPGFLGEQRKYTLQFIQRF